MDSTEAWCAPTKWSIEMQSAYSVDDLILNYDPEVPPERGRQAGLPAALKSSTGRLPGPVPRPQGHAPSAAPLPQTPAESDDFGRSCGYEVVGGTRWAPVTDPPLPPL